MIVDLERNDLGASASPAASRWPELMAARARWPAWSTSSRASRARLREDVSWADRRSRAMFPGGSVTGAPKVAAIDHIAALEPVGRGRLDGRPRDGLAQRRLRAGAHHPHVRHRRRAHPPVGRRWRRLGLATRARRSRNRGSRRDPCSRPSAASAPVAATPLTAVRRRPLAVARPGSRRRRPRRARHPRRRPGPPAWPGGLRDAARLRRAVRSRSTSTSRGWAARRERMRPASVPDLPALEALAEEAIAAAGARRLLAALHAHRRAREGGRAGGHGHRRAAARGPRGAARPRHRASSRCSSGIDPRVRRDAPWLLDGVKSTSYAVNMAAWTRPSARRRTMPSSWPRTASVLEGPVTNVWWRRGETLFTPALDLGILAGVTRAHVLRLAATARVPRRSRAGSRSADMAAADEAFTSSSVRELMPIVALDGGPSATAGPARRPARSQAAPASRGAPDGRAETVAPRSGITRPTLMAWVVLRACDDPSADGRWRSSAPVARISRRGCQRRCCPRGARCEVAHPVRSVRGQRQHRRPIRASGLRLVRPRRLRGSTM